ncbi:type IV toxin-antitoxin system AbiEi family antitoxin domain-containing protein [Paeniglutamicibacter antarcticus]|uniref:Type IV toxin-antitoxin system AbiEi family antitoxin domain-containing protein n=1 Tax=Arthrobacter terrae TaxID=2935737 RepID=A0A931CQY6_9MICC|nr:type IV toxin-antitoxin system AbiEi family antitoxin domain-containing protein [Arthrobacter terrae]MBG0740526.1 type IV toxin-antitoxin system AbiEi family antitoxin domain-containing protein [Arthrobacter terrae]
MNVLVADLAPVFTLGDARHAGLRKDQVYDLLANGEIERVGRGVYLRPDRIEPAFASLAAATAVREEATLCLTSALVHHDLSDAIPFESDIALPRGTHHPVGLAHVAWHSFDPTTFHVGRDHIDAGNGLTLAAYSAERTIVDCFRLMHQEGSDVAYEALRRWLRRRGNSPAALLKVASSFPKAQPRIRQALEALL